MPTSPFRTFGGAMLVPLKNAQAARVDVVTLAAGTYSKGQLIGPVEGVQEQQTITITGTPNGGSFTVTLDAVTSGAIAYNATAAAVRQALELMSNIGVGGVLVTGGPGPGTAWVVTFPNQANVSQMTTTDSLTGGSAPASAVTTTTAGSAGTVGTFAAYDRDSTDGSQEASHILQYACISDSGGVTLGDTAGGEWGVKTRGAPAYRCGLFACADLVGLDENAVTVLKARVINGNLANGQLMVPGA